MRPLLMVIKTLVVMALIAVAAPMARAQQAAAAPPSRMPNIPADRMTDEQRAAVAAVSPQGNLPGYLQPLLRSPALVQPTKALADHLNRRNGAIPAKLLQLPILLISKQWMYTPSWDEHAGFAARDGMNPEIVQAIKEGRRPNNLAADEQTLYDFCTELQQTMGVSDATYTRAVATFGEQGVADTIAVMGFYTYLGMFYNTTRLPAGATPAFKPAR